MLVMDRLASALEVPSRLPFQDAIGRLTVTGVS
jgi:hypothetical protein